MNINAVTDILNNWVYNKIYQVFWYTDTVLYLSDCFCERVPYIGVVTSKICCEGWLEGLISNVRAFTVLTLNAKFLLLAFWL